MYKIVSTTHKERLNEPVIEMSVPENGILTQDDVTNFFKEHPQATRIKIPEGVTTIGESIFCDCKKLE